MIEDLVDTGGGNAAGPYTESLRDPQREAITHHV